MGEGERKCMSGNASISKPLLWIWGGSCTPLTSQLMFQIMRTIYMKFGFIDALQVDTRS